LGALLVQQPREGQAPQQEQRQRWGQQSQPGRRPPTWQALQEQQPGGRQVQQQHLAAGDGRQRVWQARRQ